jgi:glyoxylate reductase
MARVFVSRQLPGPALERLAGRHETIVWPERQPPPRQELLRQAQTADGLLTLLTDRIDAELLDIAPNLKVVSNYAVGVDNIDLAAAASRGIPIGHTPDVLTDATADLAWALLLAAARKLTTAANEAAAGDWVTWDPSAYLGAEVHGATLGIIGGGRIGNAVARRATGFDMQVITAGREGDLGALLRASDFVSLHCPLTPETRHLINLEALEQMKPTAILINTARGPIVDQQALVKALHDGQIAGAALDVTDPEPLPQDDPLWSAPNVLIVPHIGSGTRTAREQMAAIAVDNLLAGLAGDPLPHQARQANAQ